MSDFSTYAWLIIAAILVAVEIATGTFYLLMLALAALVTWLADITGASFMVQTLVFLVTSVGFSSALYQYRKRNPTNSTVNKADDLDAGEIITVTHWVNGIGTTFYRGTNWQVTLHNEQQTANDGQYQIIRFEGNRLLVKPV